MMSCLLSCSKDFSLPFFSFFVKIALTLTWDTPLLISDQFTGSADSSHPSYVTFPSTLFLLFPYSGYCSPWRDKNCFNYQMMNILSIEWSTKMYEFLVHFMNSDPCPCFQVLKGEWRHHSYNMDHFIFSFPWLSPYILCSDASHFEVSSSFSIFCISFTDHVLTSLVLSLWQVLNICTMKCTK